MNTAASKVIATLIARKMAEGMEINEAFDALFGAGAYKAFASNVYHSLRAAK